jgi:hypothetical protein
MTGDVQQPIESRPRILVPDDEMRSNAKRAGRAGDPTVSETCRSDAPE